MGWLEAGAVPGLQPWHGREALAACPGGRGCPRWSPPGPGWELFASVIFAVFYIYIGYAILLFFLTIFKKKKLAQKASHIIAVSENTKKDIINFLDITEEKIVLWLIVHCSK